MDRKGSLYYSFYHANRLRFVVKHYSPEQVMLDFLPAEAARVAGDMPAGGPQGVTGTARQQARRRQRSDKAVAQLSDKWETMQGNVGEVMSGWQVYEQALYSSRPGVILHR